MGNKNTVNYRTSLSKLHSLIFLWTPKLFISPVHFSFSSKFFSYLCIYPINHGCRHGHWGHGSSLFLNPYFARDVFLEICFCVILQGIKNFFWRRHSQYLVRGYEKISNLWCWDNWKRHLWAEKLNLFIFVHSSKPNSPPGRRKLPISPDQYFVRIYFFPQQKGGRVMELKNDQT